MENGRLQFTYVYAILVAAILTLLYGYDLEDYPFPYLVFVFLVLLSILGLIWVQKVHIEVFNHIIKIERTASRLHLEGHISLPVGYGRLLSITLVFRVFYYFMIFLWSLILAYSITDAFHTAFLVSLAVIGLTYLIVSPTIPPPFSYIFFAMKISRPRFQLRLATPTKINFEPSHSLTLYHKYLY